MSFLLEKFSALRQAFYAQPYPEFSHRQLQLKALRQQLLLQQDELNKAARADFGQRDDSETRLLEISGARSSQFSPGIARIESRISTSEVA